MNYISIRLYAKTHERLRRRAFRERKPLVKLLDELSIQKPLRVHGKIG